MTANRLDIPFGRDNAISREKLRKLWNCNDREARLIIANLRRLPCEDGCAILSSSSPSQSGFWRSDDPNEIAAFVAESESRAKNIFLAVREARRVLKKCGR